MGILKRIPLIFKLIIVFAFLGLIYFFYLKYSIENKYLRDSLIKKAEVIEIKREAYESDGFSGKTDNTLIFVKYKFSYNSKEFKGEGMWIPGEFYYISPDDKFVLIQFLKDNPKENRMIKSKNGLNLIMK